MWVISSKTGKLQRCCPLLVPDERKWTSTERHTNRIFGPQCTFFGLPSTLGPSYTLSTNRFFGSALQIFVFLDAYSVSNSAFAFFLSHKCAALSFPSFFPRDLCSQSCPTGGGTPGPARWTSRQQSRRLLIRTLLVSQAMQWPRMYTAHLSKNIALGLLLLNSLSGCPNKSIPLFTRWLC